MSSSTPVDKNSNIMPEENAVSSETGFSGPRPRPRDKAPEHQYNTEVEGQAAIVGPRTGGGGPVNIGVKGGAPEAGPDAAVKETPKATGRGSRDAPSLPQE